MLGVAGLYADCMCIFGTCEGAHGIGAQGSNTVLSSCAASTLCISGAAWCMGVLWPRSLLAYPCKFPAGVTPSL